MLARRRLKFDSGARVLGLRYSAERHKSSDRMPALCETALLRASLVSNARRVSGRGGSVRGLHQPGWATGARGSLKLLRHGVGRRPTRLGMCFPADGARRSRLPGPGACSAGRQGRDRGRDRDRCGRDGWREGSRNRPRGPRFPERR